MPTPGISKHEVRLPHHVIDLDADELRSATGNHVELRPRSFAVLRLLAENAGKLVKKEDIFTTVWNDVCVTDDSLTQCIADIRKAIADDDRRVLRTVPRKGYLLVAERRRGELAGRVPDRPSLAVMPFGSASGDSDLGMGIASEIINELVRNRDLRLIARDSSFALCGRNLMARELGQELGARYLVEGTIERANSTCKVDVQLIDARDDSVAWAGRFSAAASDVHRVQSEIAAKIAASLHAGMREAVKREILSACPRDLEVYELTLRGIARKHQFNPAATRAGRADLEEAIRRDPNYAPAWAYLAWINLIDILVPLTGEKTFSQLGGVIEQFQRAVELDPYMPSAYQGFSQALIYAGDVPRAVSLARRAVELGPSDCDGLLFLAAALFEAGALDESLEAMEKAVGLNPLMPPHYCFYYAMVLWGHERYQEALDQVEDCLRKAPSFRAAATYRVMALVGLGRLDEARALFAQYATIGGLPIIPPRSPELGSRALAAMQAAGWRPTLAAQREAI